MCTCTLQTQVADALHDPVCHFILIQFVLSWLGGLPFGNDLVLRAYVCFMEACT